MYKKRLKTGTVVLAWIYDNDEYTGISIGVSDKETNNPAVAHLKVYKNLMALKIEF